MVNIKIITCLALSIFISSACKKEEEKLREKLPKLTSEGKMSFGCIYDGNLPFAFLAIGKYEVINPGLFSYCKGGCEITKYNRNPNEIIIHAENCDDYDNYGYEIYIHLQNNFKVGDKVKIGGNSQNSCYVYASDPTNWSSADSSAGFGTIMFVRADSILSGIFNITTYTDSNYPIYLTDGRFDIKKD